MRTCHWFGAPHSIRRPSSQSTDSIFLMFLRQAEASSATMHVGLHKVNRHIAWNAKGLLDGTAKCRCVSSIDGSLNPADVIVVAGCSLELQEGRQRKSGLSLSCAACRERYSDPFYHRQTEL